jgi:4-aminobutyrate aminotransferase/(S)-3-amino-2-methylpropionate transaminase
MMGFRERAYEFVSNAYSIACPYPIARGEGSYLYTTDNKRLTDFGSGIAVMNVGHAHPKVVSAIQEAATLGTHFCFQVTGFESYLKLAERLIAKLPAQDEQGDPVRWKCGFFNSGAEGIENAMKIARYATGRQLFMSFEHAFHGRTYGAMSLTAKPMPYRYKFGPFVPEVIQLPYPACYRCTDCTSESDCTHKTIDRIKQVFATRVSPNEVAAIFIEPIVGEGGFYVPPNDFLPALRRICYEHGILLVVDEVQTGICRTGTFYRFMANGVVPDLIVTAKALGGGMPLSGVLGRAHLMDSVHKGGLGTTYGGNPISIAAAHAVLDIVEEEQLCRQAVEKGAHAIQVLRRWQNQIPAIGDVRGAGLMMAIEFVKDRQTKEPYKEIIPRIIERAYEKGLVVLAAGTYSNCLRLLPALNIPDEVLEEGLALLESCIREQLADSPLS